MTLSLSLLFLLSTTISFCWGFSVSHVVRPLRFNAPQEQFLSHRRGMIRFLGNQYDQRGEKKDKYIDTSSEESDLLFSNEWENNTGTKLVQQGEGNSKIKTTERGNGWLNLPPEVKLSLIQKGQQKAIANKKKREPADAKRRRRLMFVQKSQRDKKFSAKVSRPLPTNSPNRTSLEDLLQQSTNTKMPLSGTVISLTSFGAYIDVNSTRDGLLHISQMSTNGTFVENIRDVLQPGDTLENCLYVYRCSPELSKLQLTMIPPKVSEESDETDDYDVEEESKITLEEIQVDDELWGEIQRVTNYGAFVELGAVVPGFLHFMDHPDFDQYEHPREFMFPKQRIRVWVSRLDVDRKRIQLTANRPLTLPQIRRRDDIPYSQVQSST